MQTFSFSERISTLKPSAIREIFKYTLDPEVISFAAGNPSPDAFPVDEVNEITAKIMRDNPINALQYGITEGYPALRQSARDMLIKREGIGGGDDDFIIVSGAQQGIELVTKVLCNEGDSIICEEPSFIGSLNTFRSYRQRLWGVPLQSDGIDVDRLEETLKTVDKVRFIYLIPNYQNPTGITMSLEKRKAVYELACRYNTLILEDNPYGELTFSGERIPSIKSLDTEGRVIYVGSFSKILAPGLRVGYVLAPAPVVQKVTVAKQASDVHSNMLAQLICHEFITQYNLDTHINHIRSLYREKCTLMCQCLDSYPDVAHTTPGGGLFVWCTLPGGKYKGDPMSEFCVKAVRDNKVAVVPGTAFTVTEGAPSDSFRLNFSMPGKDAIVKGIKLLLG